MILRLRFGCNEEKRRWICDENKRNRLIEDYMRTHRFKSAYLYNGIDNDPKTITFGHVPPAKYIIGSVLELDGKADSTGIDKYNEIVVHLHKEQLEEICKSEPSFRKSIQLSTTTVVPEYKCINDLFYVGCAYYMNVKPTNVKGRDIPFVDLKKFCGFYLFKK